MLIFMILFFLFYIFICVVTLKQIHTVMFVEGWPSFYKSMVFVMFLIGFIVFVFVLTNEIYSLFTGGI